MRAKGGVGGLELCRPEIPCGPLRPGSVTPLRWSNKGFLQSGMLGCLDAWMPRGVSGLEGFGDAGLEGIGDCSCKLARSSSGRGRRIHRYYLTSRRPQRPPGHGPAGPARYGAWARHISIYIYIYQYIDIVSVTNRVQNRAHAKNQPRFRVKFRRAFFGLLKNR